MNLKSYIESGVLELYALDLLSETERIGVERMLATYPQLKQEYEQIQRDFENYAHVHQVVPPKELKTTIVDSILNLQKEKTMDLENLPLINRYSNYKSWLNLASSFGNLELDQGRYVKVLRHDDTVTQLLIVSETDIEEEIHQDEYESFLILAGYCNCKVGNNVTLMGPGDFMEIPLHEPHDVMLVQKPVMAILQHLKVS